MRAFTRDSFRRIGARSPGMEFASELVINAHRAGLDIREVPVKLYPDQRGRPPHLRLFRDGWRHLRLIIAYAPDTLFLIPGAILLVAGIFGLGGLAQGPVTVAGQYFGIHFMALSSMATLIGLSAILLGTLAKVAIAIYHPTGAARVVPWLQRGRPLEFLVGSGGLLTVAALAADAMIAFKWIFVGGAMEQFGAPGVRDHHGVRSGRDHGPVGLRAEAAARQPRRPSRLLNRPMSEKPFLSVVMPVHDGVDWIEATLGSLAAEPVEDIEVIVIESSPSGETADIVERFMERLLARPDLGPWQTKTNLGVELANADYVCMLHQDDLWLPGRVHAIRRWLNAFPQAALHLAPSIFVNRSGKWMGKWRCPLPAERLLDRTSLLERLLVQNFVSVPAPVLQRRAWLACGGMDERLWYTPDWDIWLKLAAGGPVVYHDEITTAFRIHGGSLTVNGSRDAREFREQMQTVLERHLQSLSVSSPGAVEHTARASINVNVMRAAAAGGSFKALIDAAADIASLGPAGVGRYLRDSRLRERVWSRLRAKAVGAF